jgi:LmbE family N-acetylglucosaminyl deacetylase
VNILVVAAHPDDELLGCGATLRRLADEGHDVYSVILCAQADARSNRPDLDRLLAVSAEAAAMVGIKETMRFEFPNIRFNTVPHLEMVQAVESAVRKFQPSWIFTHHPGDLNVDHRVCHDVTMAAALLPQRLTAELRPVERIYVFEVLSSTDWAPATFEPFRPNAFFDVSRTIDAKVAALEHFEGALKPFPHSRSAVSLHDLARLRGAQVGLPAAEAFFIAREVM